jgi:hypothetical protein
VPSLVIVARTYIRSAGLKFTSRFCIGRSGYTVWLSIANVSSAQSPMTRTSWPATRKLTIDVVLTPSGVFRVIRYDFCWPR